MGTSASATIVPSFCPMSATEWFHPPSLMLNLRLLYVSKLVMRAHLIRTSLPKICKHVFLCHPLFLRLFHCVSSTKQIIGLPTQQSPHHLTSEKTGCIFSLEGDKNDRDIRQRSPDGVWSVRGRVWQSCWRTASESSKCCVEICLELSSLAMNSCIFNQAPLGVYTIALQSLA